MRTLINPRAAIYLRVSTADQTFRSQEHAIRGYCRRRGWRRIVFFKEKASGASTARTELDRMMQAARRGEIDVIVVFKLDRLGRSISHLTQIVAELGRLKIPLVSASEGFDTGADNAATNLTINTLATMATFERETIGARVRAGHRAARRRGVKIGRPALAHDKIARIVALRGNVTQRSANGERPLSFKRIGELVGVNASTAFRMFSQHGGKPPLQKTPARKTAARAR